MEHGISAVIPTYNRAHCITPLLERLAGQNYPKDKFEVIVVNDGSRDDTAKVVSEFAKLHENFKLISQENKGPAGARNTGWKAARFDIIAFTDDDCRPESNWLAKINEYFVKEPEIVGAGGIMYTPQDQIKVLTHHAPPLHVSRQTQAKFPGTNNVAYKKEALEKIGGFDEQFKYVSTEDTDLYIRISKLGKVVFDIDLAMPHISRPISLKSAINGYKKFYLGFKEIERKYPEEFKRIYEQKNTEKMMANDSSVFKLAKSHLRYYFPAILNPITFLKVTYYFLATRLWLLKQKIAS